MVKNIEPDKDIVVIQMPMQFQQPGLSMLDRELDPVLADHPPVVSFDCSRIGQIDSAAVNWLLTTQDKLQAASIRLQITNPSSLMHDVILAARLESRFDVQVTEVRRGGGNG